MWVSVQWREGCNKIGRYTYTNVSGCWICAGYACNVWVHTYACAELYKRLRRGVAFIILISPHQILESPQ